MVFVSCRAAEKEKQQQLREAEESLKGLQDKVPPPHTHMA